MPAGPPYPKNIFVLCKDCDVDLEDLRLTCIYCTKELTTSEVLSFALKELDIVWQWQLPHGVCAPCLSRAAKTRELRHWNYSSYGTTVEQETNTPLAQLYMRCYICCKPLCSQEKDYMVYFKERFHKISGEWTGKCCNCRVICTAARRPSRI